MVQFDKLRLTGFKSFVDPTELMIESGMTGIVGPNGCGKSNLVEALKWVMGETSAKQMRGSEMEDVIFSGAGTRPARNIAEVMLTLDNKTRTAPAAVNDTDQLDVVRRIAAELGTTPARVALAWLQSRPGVTSTIIGTRSAAQLEDNLAAIGSAPLASDEVAAIEPHAVHGTAR